MGQVISRGLSLNLSSYIYPYFNCSCFWILVIQRQNGSMINIKIHWPPGLPYSQYSHEQRWNSSKCFTENQTAFVPMTSNDRHQRLTSIDEVSWSKGIVYKEVNAWREVCSKVSDQLNSRCCPLCELPHKVKKYNLALRFQQTGRSFFPDI